MSQGLAKTLFFLFPAQNPGSMLLLSGPRDQPSSRPGVQDPSPLLPRPGGPGPQPSSRPGVQIPLFLLRPGVQTPVPPQTWGPGPQPSSRPWGPGPQPLLLRPWGPASRPLPPQTQGSRPAVPPRSDPEVQSPALPGSDAGMSPASNTHTVRTLVAQWMGICLPTLGTRVPLVLQQIPPAAGDKTRGCATPPEPAATTEAQAPRAALCMQPELPPGGRVPVTAARESFR